MIISEDESSTTCGHQLEVDPPVTCEQVTPLEGDITGVGIHEEPVTCKLVLSYVVN